MKKQRINLLQLATVSIFASKLGAILKDLSFVQFHPTALYEANQSGTYLITEALRGERCYSKKYRRG